MGLYWLVETVVTYISSVDAEEGVKFRDAVDGFSARVTSIQSTGRGALTDFIRLPKSFARRRPARGLVMGSKSSSRLDSPQGCPICRTRTLGEPHPVNEISPEADDPLVRRRSYCRVDPSQTA